MTKSEIVKHIHHAIINLTLILKVVDRNGNITLNINAETSKNTWSQIQALEEVMDLLLNPKLPEVEE